MNKIMKEALMKVPFLIAAAIFASAFPLHFIFIAMNVNYSAR